MRSIHVLLLTTIAAMAVGVPTASAAVASGAGGDPAGDGPTAAQDIVAADASYDDAGAVTASLTLAGDPAGAPIFAFLLVGTRSDASCGAPYVVLGGYSDSTAGAWGLSGDAPADYATAAVAVSGTKITVSATSPRLAGGALDCLMATVSPKGSSTTVDRLDAPVTLSAPAPPATTAPTPPPAPAPAPAPAPQPAAPAVGQSTGAAPKPQPKAAQLAVTITGVPSTIRRSRWMTLKVRVANTGTAAATGVRLRVGSARGLDVKPRTAALKTLRAGASATRRVKLALTGRARKTTKVLFTVSGAGKLAARGRLALTIGKAKVVVRPKAKPTPGPAKPRSPLAGTSWWYTINHADWAWDNHGVSFLDDHWAYRGLPKGGLPNCTTQTAGVDEKGEETDGCIPYTYDPATGSLTLGTAAGTFADGKLSIFDEGDQRSYDRLVVPDAGARYDVDLVHRSFQGLCGLIVGCTTSLDTLKLLGDGQFVKSGSTTSTMGDPGIGPFTYVGSYPPDAHGTYEVQPGGRIHLAFADGTVKDYTFAILTNQAGQPDPVNEGVMLDEDNFYKESD